MSIGTIHKILVADDGSDEGKRAADIGFQLASKLEATMILLAVIAPPDAYAIEGYKSYNPAIFRRNMQERFWMLSDLGASLGVRVYCEIVEGIPAEAIQKFAEIQGVDLIVLGRRKISNLRRVFAASVSESVMREATCSVMIAR